MNSKPALKINRRDFLEWSSLTASTALLGAANILPRKAAGDQTPVTRGRPKFSPYSFGDLGERFTFAIIGDSHIMPRNKPGAPCYDEYYQAALREIAAAKPTPAFVVVVGDVVIVEQGMRIPADCILIDGIDITVDENIYHEGRETIIKK